MRDLPWVGQDISRGLRRSRDPRRQGFLRVIEPAKATRFENRAAIVTNSSAERAVGSPTISPSSVMRNGFAESGIARRRDQ
jgi:hypothetical protein